MKKLLMILAFFLLFTSVTHAGILTHVSIQSVEAVAGGDSDGSQDTDGGYFGDSVNATDGGHSATATQDSTVQNGALYCAFGVESYNLAIGDSYYEVEFEVDATDDYRLVWDVAAWIEPYDHWEESPGSEINFNLKLYDMTAAEYVHETYNEWFGEEIYALEEGHSYIFLVWGLAASVSGYDAGGTATVILSEVLP